MDNYGNESQAPDELGLGGTGKFPKGKLNEDDQGELKIAMGINREHKKIMIDFGKEIAWMGLEAEEARAFAEGLIDAADKIDALE